MRTISRLLLLTVTASVLIFSCKKDDGGGPGDSGPAAGMGDTPGELQGTAFTLPSQITLLDTISGTNEHSMDICKESGYGSYVDVYVPFVNRGQTTTLTIPAGLTLKSLSNEDQNGIVVQSETLTFTASDTCMVYLKAYCINLSRHSSSSSSRYVFGPVTNAGAMLELCTLLKNKNIASHGSDIQSMVWNITDGQGLSSGDRATIASYPNR